MSKTKTKPEDKNETDLLVRLATSKYFRMTLANDPGSPVQMPQHVQLNEYSVRIPREEPVIISELLVNVLKHAEAPIVYTVPDPNDPTKQITKSKRREDVRRVEMDGPYTALEAHEMRLEGKIKVYPERLNPAALAALNSMKE